MKDDDIEILDFDEEIIYTRKEVKVQKKVLISDDLITKVSVDKKEIREIKSRANNDKRNIKEIETKTKKNKREKEDKQEKDKRKYSFGEKVFLIASILFIIGCFIFYGYRTYHYYHATHDVVKNITLKEKLTSLNNITYQNDGLYEKTGYFYYKGSDVNNYVYYSGRLFRIIDIDKDIRMIEDETTTNLVWGVDSTYEESNIKKWLDNYLKTLKDYDIYLVKNKWCNEKIETDNYNCEKTIEDYVGLLSISDYLQAGAKNSYLNNETYYWTINQDIDGHSLYVNSEGNINNIYKKEDNYFSYGIRPVITINGETALLSGEGTKKSPYIIEDLGNALLRDNSIGSYVTYKDSNYRIIDIDDKGVSLIYDGVLDVNKKYGDVYSYLNSTFIKTLNKSDLVKLSYGFNEYSIKNKYAITNKTSQSNYVVMPNVGDLFLNEYNGYWLNNYSDSKLGLYYTIDENDMFFSDLKGRSHKIRPIIKLNAETVVSSGTGLKGDPLIIEKEGDSNA